MGTACSCGFDGAERKVNVQFDADFALLPFYVLTTKLTRKEPEPLDKCSVCFWGQNVTSNVMTALKAELDLSKKAMEDSFGVINLRPYMQRAWNMLNDIYAIPNAGFFSLHPKKLRMDTISAKNDLLHINIGISATPVVSLIKPESEISTVPALSGTTNPAGFNIYLEASLQYDSLSKVLNGYLSGKRFDVSEGLFKKHIIVEEASVSSDNEGGLVITIQFKGSFNGRVSFTGRPFYNTENKAIEIQELEYDLQTKNLLLKTAKWLFNRRIIGELEKYTSFDLTEYYQTTSTTLNTWLNKEWTKGIKGNGTITDLKLISLHALPQHLLIRSNCAGKLTVLISGMDLKL